MLLRNPYKRTFDEPPKEKFQELSGKYREENFRNSMNVFKDVDISSQKGCDK